MEPDLKLVLDGDTPDSHIEILVWHQVMLNASPFFRTLLAPGRFIEGNKLANDGKLELSLPETNAKAMKIICDIFHLRHEDVPVSDISSSMLFEVAVLADKFDCVKPIQPWSHKWMEQDHIRQELETIKDNVARATAKDLSKWIKIHQGLGHPDITHSFSLSLIKYHTVDALTRKSNVHIDHLSPVLLENMKEMRTIAVASFHATMIEFAELAEKGDACKLKSSLDAATHDTGISTPNSWAHYLDDDSDRPQIHAVKEGISDPQFHCSSIMLGNVLLAAKQELGSTWRSLDSWTKSIDQTYYKMQQIAQKLIGPSLVVQGSLQRQRRHFKAHKNCSLKHDFSQRVEGIMQALDDEITQRLAQT